MAAAACGCKPAFDPSKCLRVFDSAIASQSPTVSHRSILGTKKDAGDTVCSVTAAFETASKDSYQSITWILWKRPCETHLELDSSQLQPTSAGPGGGGYFLRFCVGGREASLHSASSLKSPDRDAGIDLIRLARALQEAQ